MEKWAKKKRGGGGEDEEEIAEQCHEHQDAGQSASSRFLMMQMKSPVALLLRHDTLLAAARRLRPKACACFRPYKPQTTWLVLMGGSAEAQVGGARDGEMGKSRQLVVGGLEFFVFFFFARNRINFLCCCCCCCCCCAAASRWSRPPAAVRIAASAATSASGLGLLRCGQWWRCGMSRASSPWPTTALRPPRPDALPSGWAQPRPPASGPAWMIISRLLWLPSEKRA